MMGTLLQTIAFIVLMGTTSIGMLYLYAALIGFNLGAVTPILPATLPMRRNKPLRLATSYSKSYYIGSIYNNQVEQLSFLSWISQPARTLLRST